MDGCPVAIDIPGFIREVEQGNIEEAFHIINKYSALPAVCGRVCPRKSNVRLDVLEVLRESRSVIGNLSVLSQIGQERIR